MLADLLEVELPIATGEASRFVDGTSRLFVSCEHLSWKVSRENYSRPTAAGGSSTPARSRLPCRTLQCRRMLFELPDFWWIEMVNAAQRCDSVRCASLGRRGVGHRCPLLNKLVRLT